MTRSDDDPVTRRGGYHHGNLDAALVAAVRTLVERDGAGGFSMAEACKMAGVSTAAPYRHFRDKTDILGHVARAGFDELAAAMRAARERALPDDPAGLIAGLGKVYVAFALQNPETFALMFASPREVREDDRVHAAGKACFGVLIDEVARYLGRAADAQESRELSVMLWTFVHGVASLARDGDYEAAEIDVETDRLIERATRAVLAGVGR